MDARQLTMFRGDTLYFASQAFQDPISLRIVAVPQGASPPPGFVVYNLTGATLWFTMKNYLPDPDAAAIAQVTSTPATGVVVSSATSGQYNVTIAPIATRGFPDAPATCPWDVQLKDASGRIFTIEYGSVEVDPDVTRAIA